MYDARHTPRGIPVSSGASPRPDRVAGGLVGVRGLSRQKLHISADVILAETLKPQKEKRDFYFNFEELVVSNYSIDEIKNVIEDMKTNKYSTRLQNKDSDKIVGWHVRWYKKKNIYDIILKLQKCIEDYDRYEWSKEKYNAFIEEENLEIEKEAIRIKKVEDLSIKIVF